MTDIAREELNGKLLNIVCIFLVFMCAILHIRSIIAKMLIILAFLNLYSAVLVAEEMLYPKSQILLGQGVFVNYSERGNTLFDVAGAGFYGNDLPEAHFADRSAGSLTLTGNEESNHRILMFDLFRNHGSIMLLIDPDTGIILDANNAAVNYYGYTDLIGMNIDNINLLTYEQWRAEIAKAVILEQNYFEFRHIVANGDIRDVEVYSYPVDVDNRQILFSIINDVTDKKRAVEASQRATNNLLYTALSGILVLSVLVLLLIRYILGKRKIGRELKESEGRFKELFNGVKDLLVVCDPTGLIIKVNQTALEVLGERAVAGRNLRELVSHGTFKRVVKYIQRQVCLRNSSFGLELQITNYKGEILFLDIKGYIKYNKDGNPLEIFSIARDINIHKELNRKILQSVIDTEERERNRIAAELHDGIGPLLSGLKMYLQQDVLTENISQKQFKLLAYSRQLVDDAIDQVRTIVYNITPAIIDEFGLEKALNTFINKVDSLGICEINFKITPGAEKVEPNMSLVVYRIATELINNALKHANCNELTINIEILKNTLILFYSDDGNSFNVEEVLSRQGSTGMGITNIFNRVKILSGQIEFDRNKTGRGMYAIIRFPLQVAG